MILRCVAIDDEPLALELLAENINGIPFLKLVATCRSALEAMQYLETGAIDLVFSDVQMPGLSGVQLIQCLNTKPMFVLITAHEKFAVEGFELDVVDYLLKPVAYERFVKACNKALSRKMLQDSGGVQKVEIRDHVFLPVDYKMVRVPLNDIAIVEAVKDYVRIGYVNSNKSLLVRISMKSLIELLPESSFLRIHKSYIVNVRHVSAVKKMSLFVGEQDLPIGEQYRDAVRRLVAIS